MQNLSNLTNEIKETKEKVEKIKLELMKKWSLQTERGFERLYKAYRFFMNNNFSAFCSWAEDMRLGGDGKEDFYKFIDREINPSCEYSSSNYKVLDDFADEAANKYFKEQADRLANYIVRIAKVDEKAWKLHKTRI